MAASGLFLADCTTVRRRVRCKILIRAVVTRSVNSRATPRCSHHQRRRRRRLHPRYYTTTTAAAVVVVAVPSPSSSSSSSNEPPTRQYANAYSFRTTTNPRAPVCVCVCERVGHTRTGDPSHPPGCVSPAKLNARDGGSMERIVCMCIRGGEAREGIWRV